MDFPSSTPSSSSPYWQAKQFIQPTAQQLPNIASATSSSTHEESYLEKLLRAKSQSERMSIMSSTTYTPQQQPAPRPLYSSSSPSPASLPAPGPWDQSKNGVNQFPYSLAPNASAAPFPKVEPASHPPLPSVNNNHTVSNTPTSRFHQLLHLKLAAERSVSSANRTMSQVPVQMTQAFARLQDETSNTVTHKDFASRHYNYDGQQQQSVQQGKDNGPVHQASFRPPAYPPLQQPQPSLNNSPTNFYTPQPNSSQYYPPTNSTQNPPQTYGNRQDFADASSVTNHIMNVYTPQFNMYNPGATAQNMARTAGSSPPNYYTVTVNSGGPCHPSTMDSNNAIYSGPSPFVRNDGQGAQPWVTALQSHPSTSDWSRSMAPPFVPYHNREAPSFAWNVSEVRTPANEFTHMHPQAQQTPSLVPSDSASTVSPLPVTPSRQDRFDHPSHIPAAYTQIKIKTEPETSPSHLAVPYGRSTPVTPLISSSPCPSASPLLSYGVAMFANMNGAVQFPGSGMYTSSMNGNDGNLPQTLADGLAGGAGGDGSSGGSNGGSGDGWGDGTGGSGGGEASGSGQGNGDDNGGSSGGDGNGDGGDGNGDDRPPKGKKLALACHFCRRRKLKCNGQRPKCDHCTKRNEECTWDDNVRRRGPGKATKERRDKAAREALEAGLTNANSLGAIPANLPEIAPAPAPLPEGDPEIDPDINSVPILTIPDDNGAALALDHELDLPEEEFDPNIPIDPALAALSAAIPGTLAELEVKKEGKRKSDVADGLDGMGANGEKRFRLDDGINGLL